ncbi:MAG: M23 family metallopeptidase [Candidatus Hydrogenedentota bacterium]|nr:MAG: M23 family metallopeptidase [Candidatus Hydrogenedentota bacterium]
MSASKKAELGSPMQMPLMPSGSFGEFRPSHLHMGVDFRTYKINGIPVTSMEDGYIFRIHGSPYGFGQAIYVMHPKLKKYSVYGHLSRLTSSFDLAETWELLHFMEQGGKFNVIFEEGKYPVRKGDVIAYTGERGSGVSHLHVELWDKDKISYNLLKRNYLNIEDTTPPVIEKIIVKTPDRKIQGRTEQSCRPEEISIQGKVREYTCNTIKVDGKVFIQLQGYDRTNVAINKLGITGFLLRASRLPIFAMEFDKIARKDTWNLKKIYDSGKSSLAPVHYTYNLYWRSKKKIPPFILILRGEGDIDVSSLPKGENVPISIETVDSQGNLSIVKFSLKKVEGRPVSFARKKKNIRAGQKVQQKIGNVEVLSNKLRYPARIHVSRVYKRLPRYLKVKEKAYKIEWESGYQKLTVYYYTKYKRRLWLYNQYGRPFKKLRYNFKKKAYELSIYATTTIIPAEDMSPPSYSLPLVYGPMERDLFCLQAWDKGSGIDPYHFEVYVDGQKLTKEQKELWQIYYDKDRHGFLIPTGLAPKKTSSAIQEKPVTRKLWLRAYDKAGNAGKLWKGYIQTAF